MKQLLQVGQIAGTGNAIVQFLLNHRANMQSEDGNLGTTLCLEASNGDSLAVNINTQLSQEPVDPNLPDQNDSTPLHEAAKAGHLSMVAELLGHPGIDIHAQDILGNRLLWYATYNGHLAVTRLLLEHNANVNTAGEWSMHLHHAVQRRDEEMA